MKITLNRTMQLQTAEVFLSLERDTKRSDIQKYLNGERFETDMINNGVKNYLKTVGIYDENYNLTQYGNSIKNTGIFKAKEKGKYKIWLDGNKIVFIQRIQPLNDNGDIQSFDIISKEASHYCIPTDKENFYRFTIKDLNKIYGKILAYDNSVSQTIEITEDGSNTIFSGKFEQKVIISNKSIPENVENPEIKLLALIQLFFNDWDSNFNRLKIQMKGLDNNSLEYFETNISKEHDLFKVQVDKIPVEPYNLEEAGIWRNRLLNIEIAKGYLTENDFNSIVRKINKKEGFAAYMLDNPNIRSYVNDETEIKPYTPEYWHLQAPLDLNPDIPRDMIVDNFCLSQEEKMSLLQIQKKIESSPIDAVFYYDRYVISGTQQRMAGHFIDSFNSTKKYIITNLRNENRKSRFIATQKKHVKEIDIKEVFGDIKKVAHNRYLIYTVGENMTVWNISHSMDYIEFQKGEFLADTIGEINDGVSFTKVNPKILNKELQHYINEETKKCQK